MPIRAVAGCVSESERNRQDKRNLVRAGCVSESERNRQDKRNLVRAGCVSESERNRQNNGRNGQRGDGVPFA